LSAGEFLKKIMNADGGHYLATCFGGLTPWRLLSGALVKSVAATREVAQLVQSICHAAVSRCEIAHAAVQTCRCADICFGKRQQGWGDAAAAHKLRHSIGLKIIPFN